MGTHEEQQRLQQRTSRIPVDVQELWDWHMRPGALQRLLPPWQSVRILQADPPAVDAEVRLRLRLGPFFRDWIARHESLDEPHGFTDVQHRGPFAAWRHAHRFQAQEDGVACLEDRIHWKPPWYARPMSGRLRQDIDRMLAFRHRRTADDCASHGRWAGRPRLTVLVTGASGLVGTQLCAFLRGAGHSVRTLSRAAADPAAGRYHWDPAAGELDEKALLGVDAVVHLAGANIAGRRWSASYKRTIRESRVQGTDLLARRLAACEQPPGCLIAASATGWYGDTGEAERSSGAPPGEGFLATVCREWEAAAQPARTAGIRTAHLRFGMILSAAGGALASMLPAFRLGLGGRLGSGRQWISWIALDDVLGLIEWALHDGSLAGTCDAVAPEPVRQVDFARCLGRVLHRPTVLPAPATALRLVLGGMADALLLQGSRIPGRDLQELGFVWRYGDLERCLAHECGLSQDGPLPCERFQATQSS